MKAKVIISLINALKNDELRNNLIMLITIITVVFTMIILIPMYIILNPIETIKEFLGGDEEVLIYDIKQNYAVMDYGMGSITINGKLGFPLETVDKVVITANYGLYDPWNTGTYTKHTGIDLSGIHRDNVLAVEKGIVVFAGVQNGYGNCVELKHEIDGQILYTFYGHLSSIGVRENQEVEQGYIIGKEGGDPYTDLNAGNSTGHHLHFEVRTSKEYGSDINPKEFIY